MSVTLHDAKALEFDEDAFSEEAPTARPDDHEEKYPRPSLTADVVLVTLGEAGLRALFIRRKHPPFEGHFALPGGFVDEGETAAEAAARELHEETGLSGVRLEELGCFSKPGRDPRGWTVSIAHLALAREGTLGEVKAGDDAAEAAWLDLSVADEGRSLSLRRGGEVVETLAFDHRAILALAVLRLAARADELAFALLPPSFTLAEAERAFAALLGARLDRAALGARLVSEGRVCDEGREGIEAKDARDARPGEPRGEARLRARRYVATGSRRPFPFAAEKA
jgi:8-oxo-dGTP diphosphatase